MKVFFKFILKAFSIFLLGLAGLLLLLKLWLSHPSDQTMIRNFEKNRTTFNELIQMIQADKGLERVDDDWTRPSDPSEIGVTPERIAQYRKIFDQLDIPRGFYSFTDPTRIELIAHTFGISVSGSSKSYLYVEHKPEPLVDNLDDYRSPDGKSFTAYRQIAENWYLVYQYED